MKALTLWQPWASLIAVGAKKYETRSWSTHYRGPLLICAGKNLKAAMQGWYSSPKIRAFLSKRGFTQWQDLPFGVAVAVVDLTKIIPTENCFPAQMEGALPFGDFSPGRFAWKLEKVRPLREPFPVRGQPGLFEVSDTLLEEVR